MAIGVASFPVLSPAQADPIGEGLTAGILAHLRALEAQRLSQQMPYVAPQAAAQVGLTQAQIPVTQAQAALIRAQTGAVPSEIALRQAQAGLFGVDAQQKGLLLGLLREYIGQNGNVSSSSNPMMNGGSNSYANQSQNQLLPNKDGSSPSIGSPSGNGNSAYGVTLPQMQPQDVINKMLFGVDTFSTKQQLAAQQIQDQYQKSIADTTSANQAAQAANNMNQLMQQYNNLSGKFGSETGPIIGLLPAITTNSQNLQNIVTQMQTSGIQQLRSAMGNSRFSNLDMSVASNKVPVRKLTGEAGKFYTNWLSAVNNRMIDQSKFMNLLSQPNAGATDKDRSALWTAYQKNNPISNAKGDKVNTNFDNINDYVTPQAIATVRATGTFKPVNSINSQNQNSIILPASIDRQKFIYTMNKYHLTASQLLQKMGMA